MADSDPRKTAILESYTRGFHAVFVATTAVAASALVAGFLIWKFKTTKTWLNQTDMAIKTFSSTEVMTALTTLAVLKPTPMYDERGNPA
jgi:hypothetical protein